MKKRRLHKNIHILINTAAIVLIWRGLWDLFDLYVFPENIVVSSLLGILIGIAILLYKDQLIDELR